MPFPRVVRALGLATLIVTSLGYIGCTAGPEATGPALDPDAPEASPPPAADASPGTRPQAPPPDPTATGPATDGPSAGAPAPPAPPAGEPTPPTPAPPAPAPPPATPPPPAATPDAPPATPPPPAPPPPPVTPPATPPPANDDPETYDEVFGQSVPRSQAYWTGGGHIYRGAERVRLVGANWFGLEGEALALYGPSQANRSVADFLGQLRQAGFNALRIPVAPESIRSGTASATWAVRDGLTTGRQHLDELLAAARDAKMRVLLDIHTCRYTVGYMAGSPTDPMCGGYGESDWLADLTALAALAKDYAPWVVGIDLFNEPHALDWPTWRGLAERGGEAVLRENPNILVFVEGVGGEGYSGSHGPFWGENLSGVATDPVRLPASRLVYSPHVYGPSVYAQPYFSDGSFPANMPAIWDAHFGFLADGRHTLAVGEFGGRYEGLDRTWQDAFVAYLVSREIDAFFYWSLNPNSGDTGGLLQDDWRSFRRDKLELLAPLMP